MTPRSTCPNDVCIITDAVDGCRGGRRLTTARAVQPGEVILCAAPAISWPHDGVSELVSGFLSADGAVQMSILSLADPSLDADLDLIPDPAWRHEATTTRLQHACERTELARSIAEGFQGGRVLELVEKLLRIAEANCHAFESRVGLFPLASIANHSCEPNCGHTTHGGALRYYANRAIAEGEQITISYLCDLLATSTRERRTTLLLQKCFFCCCARCARSHRAELWHPRCRPPALTDDCTSSYKAARAAARLPCELCWASETAPCSHVASTHTHLSL